MNSNSHQKPPNCARDWCADLDSVYSYLYDLLIGLDGVLQSPKYHPERDALYHSLQVFQCSLNESNNPKLWAAALFHDVGKAIDYENHDEVGAEELSVVISEDVCWLVRHHLDLLISPSKTKRKLKGTKRLSDLEKLRRWDLQGRKTDAVVMEVDEALNLLWPYAEDFIV